MKEMLKQFDARVIGACKNCEISVARIALFVIYFWFGALKLFNASPATPLVHSLFEKTLAGLIPFNIFYALFSAFEVLIGILFLVRGAERVVLALLGIHLVTTSLPLLFLPNLAWNGFLIPTLEGQYIIKNILIVALAIVIGSRLIPLRERGVGSQ